MSGSTLQAACLQLTPGDDRVANLDAINRLVTQAAGSGGELVALPGYCTFLIRSSCRMGESAETWSRSRARASIPSLTIEAAFAVADRGASPAKEGGPR